MSILICRAASDLTERQIASKMKKAATETATTLGYKSKAANLRCNMLGQLKMRIRRVAAAFARSQRRVGGTGDGDGGGLVESQQFGNTEIEISHQPAEQAEILHLSHHEMQSLGGQPPERKKPKLYVETWPKLAWIS